MFSFVEFGFLWVTAAGHFRKSAEELSRIFGSEKCDSHPDAPPATGKPVSA